MINFYLSANFCFYERLQVLNAGEIDFSFSQKTNALGNVNAKLVTSLQLKDEIGERQCSLGRLDQGTHSFGGMKFPDNSRFSSFSS